MKITQILGIQVTYAKYRENYRTGFFDSKVRSMGTGATLMLITDGGAVFDTGTRQFQAGKNDWVFWNEGRMANYRPLPRAPYSAFIIRFKLLSTPDAPAPLCLELPFRFRLRQSKKSESLLRALVATYSKGGPGHPLTCARIALTLLEQINRTRLKSLPDAESSLAVMDPRIRKSLVTINDQFKDRLLVSDLAARVGMHPVNFTRLFTRSTGIAPHRFVLEKKIEKAKDFITSLEDAPESTSQELGFHDYAHFYRTFKRLTGVTPSAYVKAFRK